MNTILIVDDEVLVRTNIKLMLNNCDVHFAVCGEACNGIDALSKIELLHPDIILSDIKMPEMDGLELCKKVRELYPDIAFIALSNYDDFAYVRGTLKNGGVDYLLKHELSPQLLISTMKNISTSEKEEPSSYNVDENSLNVLRENFVNNLISGSYSSTEELIHTCDLLRIPIDHHNLVPIVLSIDRFAQTLKKEPLNRQSIIEFSITNIGNEVLHNTGKGILTHVFNEYYCILLSFSHTNSTAEIEQQIQSTLHLIAHNMKTYLNLSTSFSIGSLCNNFSDIPISFSNALDKLKYTFYLGSAAIIHSDENPSIHKSSLEGLDEKVEQQLLSYLLSGDLDSSCALLAKILKQIKEEHYSIQSAQIIFNDLAGCITRAIKKSHLSMDDIFSEIAKPHEILFSECTIEQMEHWFQLVFQAFTSQMKSSVSTDSGYVKMAINIISRDYSKALSQQSVADEIGISSGYLSTIFKSETGKGFNEYLTAKRIAIASQMLQDTTTDFHKIASACGFQDYTYFFRVFKKKVGITPTEFRDKHKNLSL